MENEKTFEWTFDFDDTGDLPDCSPERLEEVRRMIEAMPPPPEWVRQVELERKHWRRNLEIWNNAKFTGVLH